MHSFSSLLKETLLDPTRTNKKTSLTPVKK
nr:MAG TPA: hypothetical protein [Caudoviricetes sp.]